MPVEEWELLKDAKLCCLSFSFIGLMFANSVVCPEKMFVMWSLKEVLGI